MYENNCLLVIFLQLNGIAKIKNAKIKMLRFGTQIAKISNRRKYPLYGMTGPLEECNAMPYNFDLHVPRR